MYIHMYMEECADIRADVVLAKGGAPGLYDFFGKGWAIRRSCIYGTHARVKVTFGEVKKILIIDLENMTQ